jgi:hypothetical protein
MNYGKNSIPETDFHYIAAVKTLLGIEPTSFTRDHKGTAIALYEGASLPTESQLHIILTAKDGTPIKEAAFAIFELNYQYYRNKMLSIARNEIKPTGQTPKHEPETTEKQDTPKPKETVS